MIRSTSSSRVRWSSRAAFILTAAGSAVGLGNIWKFPYITGRNGGGLFVLVYLVSIAFVGLPILLAELKIGQTRQMNAVDSYQLTEKKSALWYLPGILAVLTPSLVLSYYSVVGGWIIDYLFSSLRKLASSTDAMPSRDQLEQLLASPSRQLLGHTCFLFATIVICFGGVNRGLEKCNKVLMPGLLILLGALFVYCLGLEGFEQAWHFLFDFKVLELKPKSLLEAIGHSFFTLGLGAGVMLTFGSYLEKSQDLFKIGLSVAILDTSIALLAGLIVFSISFSYGMSPSSGPGLIFNSLPALFEQMRWGDVVAIVFFLSVAFAALSSSVSMLQPSVTLLEEKFGFSTFRSVSLIGGFIFLVGVLNALSFNVLSNIKILGRSVFDFFDNLSSCYFMPISGFFAVFFLGWRLRSLEPEMELSGISWVNAWLWFSVRWISPVSLVILVLYLAL